jgi:hypothetical protein
VIELVRILVDAGATPVSAVRSAAVIERGGSLGEAWEEIELAPKPVDLDAALLSAAIARERERVLVELRVRG